MIVKRSRLPALLAQLLLILLTGIAAGAQTNFVQDFQTVKVADGIYAFIATESRSAVVQGNSVVILGDDGVLVVDAGQYPSLARRMIAEIRKLADKPVRVLVTTHWHGDHNLANGQYREAFPETLIVSHTETRRLMDKYDAPIVRNQAKEYPELVTKLRERLKTGIKRDGSPMTEEDKVHLAADIEAVEAIMPEFPQTRYAPPGMTFRQEVSFFLGNREVKVMHIGLGNTSGDAVVYVPDARVLITGDTVVFPTPYSFGSYLGEWIETLKKMTAMDAVSIVPGHGPVMQDTSYIQTLIALIGDVRAQVQAAVKDGLSLEDTRKRVNLEKFRSLLAGDNRYRRRAFQDFFVQPAVAQAYKEAKGEPLVE